MRAIPLDEFSEIGNRSSESAMRRPSLMGRVEAEIVWTGSRARAEALLAAVAPDDPESFDAEIVDVGGSSELRIRVIARSSRRCARRWTTSWRASLQQSRVSTSSTGLEGLGRGPRGIHRGITQMVLRLDMTAGQPYAVLEEHGAADPFAARAWMEHY